MVFLQIEFQVYSQTQKSHLNLKYLQCLDPVILQECNCLIKVLTGLTLSENFSN